MVKKNKKYICAECGHVFSEELAKLIEDETQVYCENCGTPFSLEGTVFTEREYEPAEKIVPEPVKKKTKTVKAQPPKKEKKHLSNLKKGITTLDSFSYIPILIVSILIYVGIVGILFNPGDWIIIIIRQVLFGTAGLIIALYDKKVISKKIKEEKFDTAFLESFCIGILGCIIYGSGVIILIKGIMLMIFVIYSKSQQKRGAYKFLTSIKDSFLKFSTKFGLIIVLLGVHAVIMGPEPLYREIMMDIKVEFPNANPLLMLVIPFAVFFFLALVSLLIHNKVKNKLLYNPDIKVVDFIKTLILGILATTFFASGIFILLEGTTLLIFYFVKPSEKELEAEKVKKSEAVVNPFKTIESARERGENVEKPVSLEQREKIEQEITKIKDEERLEPISSKEEAIPRERKKERPLIKEEERKEEEETEKVVPEPQKPEEKLEEYKLKLHESLLPVKDKKDKKLVTKYFSKIFNILSKDIREQIEDLNLSKKERKEILKELAFLSKEKQIKYIDAIVNLYQEQIPKDLVERIRHLPNVKTEHYQKIVNELKYLDRDEQLRFIDYLEKYA